jgi:hypothetical protein
MTPVADMVKSFAARHAMVSFEHPEQIKVCAEICQSVALDNGAFSAWRQEKPYDFAGYVEWCSEWLRHPSVDWCIIPDKIDGNEADNDALMVDWPFATAQSVPVWHLHESLGRLERLMAWPRVALGSSGAFAEIGTKEWWFRMSEAMAVLCDDLGRPKIKIHGLRMLDPGVFSKLPFASADSCNVARNVGLDSRWRGAYSPDSRAVRALILMDRIERHASSAYWNADAIGAYQNMELFG